MASVNYVEQVKTCAAVPLDSRADFTLVSSAHAVTAVRHLQSVWQRRIQNPCAYHRVEQIGSFDIPSVTKPRRKPSLRVGHKVRQRDNSLGDDS